MSYESGSFLERFHDNSFLNLVNTLYDDHKVTDEDLEALKQWLNAKE